MSVDTGQTHPESGDITDLFVASMFDVAFRTGIDLSLQRLPTGTEYLYLPNAHESLQHVMDRLLFLEDNGVRAAAISFTQSLERELSGGQRQLLLRPEDFTKQRALNNNAVQEVVNLLRLVA